MVSYNENDMKNTDSKKKKKSGKTRWRIILLVLAGVIISGGILMYMYVSKTYQGDSRWVYIPKDATIESLSDSLLTNLGSSGDRVLNMWKAADGIVSLSHGAYYIEKGEKEIDIARRIKRGQQTPVKVTINNCRTLEQLAEKVAEKMELTRDEFLAGCEAVLPEAGFKSKEQYAAAFFPDTYEFYWSSEPSKVVKRLLEYRNNYWTDERREKAKSMGLTPVKVATLASIVEEETNKSDERPKVARLYLNRLAKGMLLQADPTVKFALGDFGLRRITSAHLDVESPYNTYKHTGLPPGPIRVVNKSTLDAVLNAPDHKYLYMCAKEDFSGYHNFAVDYSTHLSNARRYQAELNRRKIYK